MRQAVRILLGIIVGVVLGILITAKYYDDKYIKLRSEIIMATDPTVDISYPYGDGKTLNKSWFIIRFDKEK